MEIDPAEHWGWYASKAAREIGISLDANGGLPLAALLGLDDEDRLYRAGRALKALFCPDSFMEFLQEYVVCGLVYVGWSVDG